MFLVAAAETESLDGNFHETVRTIGRCPVYFHQKVVSAACPDITVEEVKAWKKAGNSAILSQLFSFATGLSSKTELWARSKHDVFQSLVERSKALQAFSEMTVSEATPPEWTKCGWYRLLPAMGNDAEEEASQDEDPEKHVYKRLSFTVAGKTVEAPPVSSKRSDRFHRMFPLQAAPYLEITVSLSVRVGRERGSLRALGGIVCTWFGEGLQHGFGTSGGI